MTFINALVLIVSLLFTTHGRSEEVQISSQVARIQHSDNYEEPRTACTLNPQANSPYDFDVTCAVGKEVRVYVVHVAVSHYDDTAGRPQAFLEILYWVQDLGTKAQPHAARQYGTTLRLNAKSLNGMTALDLTQDLGTAEQLHFELRVPVPVPVPVPLPMPALKPSGF